MPTCGRWSSCAAYARTARARLISRGIEFRFARPIVRRFTVERGKRVAANSVYRILDLFVRTNLANRVESANAYLANSHPGCRHDCIFLICDDCGQATHLDDDKLTGALREAGRGAGFSDVRPVIELRGLCEECAG